MLDAKRGHEFPLPKRSEGVHALLGNLMERKSRLLAVSLFVPWGLSLVVFISITPSLEVILMSFVGDIAVATRLPGVEMG
jgi:hypothetical protein